MTTVKLGNVAAKMANGASADHLGGAPTVTDIHLPDGYGADPAMTGDELRRHLGDAALSGNGGLTRLPGCEGLLAVAHPVGAWNFHSSKSASWVYSDDPQVARILSEFYGCPQLAADQLAGLEDTHHTIYGPPGVGPWAAPVTGLLLNSGRDMFSLAMGGGTPTGDVGTATGTTATTLSDTAKAWTTNEWAGRRVVLGGAYGIVVSNTATALTIDQWTSSASPGGAAAATPATGAYAILPGGPPGLFVALTANTAAPAATDTTLPGEIVTAGGGLVRKVAAFAHSAGTNTYTLTPVFTANGSDSLPVTVAKIGVFSSPVVGATPTMLFETQFAATATLSSSGDQLTVTETVTTS